MAKEIPESIGEMPKVMGLLLDTLDKQVEERIESKIDSELKELNELVQTHRKIDIINEGETHTIEGLQHKKLEELIKVSSLRMNALLVGMAGTGKTHGAQQVSEALGLDFYAISVGAQTSKSDIIGYMSASGTYIKTAFRDAYENGGVFLMDEIDAGNANVLIQINSALSNGLCSFPDQMVKRHKDFVFVASANTYGNGASRQYVGRNQLDAATLDRFTIIDWDVDQKLERSIAIGQFGDAWCDAVISVRKFVVERQIRALVTPRATEKGALLLSAGFHVDDVINSVLLSSVPEDRRNEIANLAKKSYEASGAGRR